MATPVQVSASSAGLTTASTAYTAGDQLGNIIELTSAISSSGGYGRLHSLRLLDKAKVIGGVEAFLFDATVTLAANNAGFSVSDADMEGCVGSVILPPPSDAGAAGIATRGGGDLVFKLDATSLFVALKTLQGHTFFGAVDDLFVAAVIETL